MTRGFIYNTITKRGLYKSTNFPLKNKINKDFNLKNTNLFFGFRKKYYLCIRNQ